MASIVLRNFGGMAPSANPQALPESTATWVQNLNLRFADFRPLATPSSVQAATSGQALYRFETSGTFITRAGAVSFVRGLIPNDATERTYYTGDGVPKVVDVNGDVRQLGVPAPSAAPSVTVLKNDEFSESDAVGARNAALEHIKYDVRGALSLDHYAYNVVAQVGADLAARFNYNVPESLFTRDYVGFLVPLTASPGGGYTPTNPSHNNLLNSQIAFRITDLGGGMTGVVQLRLRASGAVISPNMADVIEAVPHPLTNAPFIRPEVSESVVLNITERIKVPNQVRDECVKRMLQIVGEFVSLADTAAQGSDASARLGDLCNALEAEARKIEAAYQSFLSGVNSMLKSTFAGPLSEAITGIKLLDVTRAYVETFVTDRGEESAPSPASELATLDQNDSATVSVSAAPASRFITKRRLYRSATTANNAVWRLQGEYPVAQTLITDDKLDAELQPDVLVTTGWREPPANLQGLAGMSNGILLGYVDSTLYACEPYYPYAWPEKYRKPLPHKFKGIVGLGQSALIGTTGYPYLVSGSDAMSLTEQKLPNLVPCASGRSMVAIGNAVFYAGTDGLALYENGQVAIVTEGIIDRAAWGAYNPQSMFAIGFDGRYFAFYTKAGGARGCLAFDYKSRTIAELAQQADAAFSNEAGAYVLDGAQILDMLPRDGVNRTGTWKSKIFRLAQPQAMLWLHVDAYLPADVTVRVYAGGNLHHTAVVTNAAPVRLPPGRFTQWQVEVESNAIVSGVVLASSTDELKAVL